MSTLAKLMEDGLTVRCPPEPGPGLAAKAGEVRATISKREKRKGEKNPEIPDH